MNPEIQRYFSFAIITALRNMRNRSASIEEADKIYQQFAMIVAVFDPITCVTGELVKDKLWQESINNKEDLILLIVEALAGLRLSTAFGSISYGDLVGELALAFSSFCTDKSNVIDKNWIERTTFASDQSIQQFKELLTNNGWIVVLIIAKFVDLPAIATQVLLNEPTNYK